jgi:glycosyltransferase involved in cell wall biosynthesis
MPMTSRLLLDQSNIALRMGTGIATYGRNLAAAARGVGYAVDALVSTDSALDRRNPLLSEVALFDTPVAPALPWLRPAISGLRGALRAPFGYRLRQFADTGAVLRPPGQAPAFERTYVGTRLFEEARAHFYIHGRFAPVRLAHAPALFHASQPLPLRVAGCPNIVTIHDLVPLRLPYMTLDNKRYFYRLIKRHIAEADHVVTVSEFSRRDIIALFGIAESRISNAYQAVSLPPRVLAKSTDEVADEVSNLFDLEPQGYYLFIGALEPKKNVGRLIDAYAASGSRRPLVIAGGQGWQNERELERIGDPRYAHYRVNSNIVSQVRRVRRVAYLPIDQLFTLLRGARALLFPSVFEGFGLPVLEAMALGTPVMTANVTSLPEVAGDAALLVDPYDVSAMARAIRQLDHDDDLRASLAARGRDRAALFSMARYQARIGAIYAGLHG